MGIIKKVTQDRSNSHVKKSKPTPEKSMQTQTDLNKSHALILVHDKISREQGNAEQENSCRTSQAKPATPQENQMPNPVSM